MMNNPVHQFRDAIKSAGLIPPDEIEADGKLRRFGSNGKHGDDAGWYVLHDGNIPAGCFGDWRTGFTQTWRADIGRSLTPGEEAAHRARAEAMRREREAEEARRKSEAKAKAAAIWQKAEPDPGDHPYLTRKRIKAHGTRLYRGALLIPMRAGGDQFCLADSFHRPRPPDSFILAGGDARRSTGELSRCGGSGANRVTPADRYILPRLSALRPAGAFVWLLRRA